jgi:hypothetical protein
MAITPYDNPAQLQILPIPFEQIAAVGLAKQKRLDTDLAGIEDVKTTLGKLKSATFDTNHRDAVQKEYNTDAVRITNLLMQDDPNAHKELLGLKSKITMDSRLTTLQNNYDKEVLHDKDKADMLKDKDQPYRFWNDSLVSFLQERKTKGDQLTPFNYQGIEAHSNPYDAASKIVGNIAETQLAEDGFTMDKTDPLGLRYYDVNGKVGIIDDARFQNIIKASVPIFLNEPGGRSYVKELQYGYGVTDPKKVETEISEYLKSVAYKQIHIKGGGYKVGHLPDSYKQNPYADVVTETSVMEVSNSKIDDGFFDMENAGTTIPYTAAEATELRKNFTMSDPGDRSAYAGLIAAGKRVTTPGYKDPSALPKAQKELFEKMVTTLKSTPEYKTIAEKYLMSPSLLTIQEKGKLYKGLKEMNSSLGTTGLFNSTSLSFDNKDELNFAESMFGNTNGQPLTTNKLGTGWAANLNFMDENGSLLSYTDFIAKAKELDPEGTSLVTVSGKLNGDNAADLRDGGTRFSNGFYLSVKGHSFFSTGPSTYRTDKPMGQQLEQNRIKNTLVAQINKAQLHGGVNRNVDHFGVEVGVGYDKNSKKFFIMSYDGSTSFSNANIAPSDLVGFSAEDLANKIDLLDRKLRK